MVDWEDFVFTDGNSDYSWKEAISFGMLGEDGSFNVAKEKVLGWVAAWLVAGLLAVRNQTIEWIDTAYETYEAALASAGGALLDSFGVVGSVPTGMIDAFDVVLSQLVSILGPFAIVAYVLIGAGILWLLRQMLQFTRARIGGIIPVW